MIQRISEDLLWSQIVARAWHDEDFMQRLLSDPRAVLAEYDLEGPPGSEVAVEIGPEVKVEDTGKVRRFMLPARPAEEVAIEDLSGSAVAYCWCGVCGRCGACGCRCRC
ncbi:MAG TPA: hypothetical protein VMG10_00835 [Gemmataceae bacterium]|nr:hypothetical protein [Gemmataceae bacterium]